MGQFDGGFGRHFGLGKEQPKVVEQPLCILQAPFGTIRAGKNQIDAVVSLDSRCRLDPGFEIADCACIILARQLQFAEPFIGLGEFRVVLALFNEFDVLDSRAVAITRGRVGIGHPQPGVQDQRGGGIILHEALETIARLYRIAHVHGKFSETEEDFVGIGRLVVVRQYPPIGIGGGEQHVVFGFINFPLPEEGLGRARMLRSHSQEPVDFSVQRPCFSRRGRGGHGVKLRFYPQELRIHSFGAKRRPFDRIVEDGLRFNEFTFAHEIAGEGNRTLEVLRFSGGHRLELGHAPQLVGV